MIFVELLELLSISTKLILKHRTEEGTQVTFTTAQQIFESIENGVKKHFKDLEVLNVSHTESGITVLLH